MPCAILRRLLVVTLAAISTSAFAQVAEPPPPEVTPEEVRTAIEFGVTYLLKNQRPDGSWGEYPLQPTGKTALVALALLNSGVSPEDPKLKSTLDWLEKQEAPRATYAASLQIMALVLANPVRYKPRITSLAMWLEERQYKDGDEKGGWTYYDRPGPVDNSNSQFAVLALHEAERAGVKIKEQTWKLALDYWIDDRRQHPDGSWSYGLDNPAVSGSMTCAGIASAIIARDRLSVGDASVRGTSIQCCGAPADPAEQSIERGLKWMARKFTATQNPNTAGLGGVSRNYPWLLYYLYGVERVGRMSGQRFIGKHDWYREGCRFLIDDRNLNGSWQGTGPGEADPVIGTALALLFLSKGRRPVVVARLMHGGGDVDWNLYRRSIQNLVGRVERQWKRDLAWQTFDLQNSTVVSLLESPVLFLSGSQSLRLSPDDEAKLKEYVNQGGFIFAEACDGDGCNGAAFDRDFRALVGRLFPESQLRRLPPDHAVWFAQERVNPKDLPNDEEFWLWGLDACCRTAIVYCPRSLTCRWELSHPYRELPHPDDVKRQIEACVRIGGNVLAYATNRELKDKLEKPQVSVLVNKGGVPRGALAIPKLEHGGGADDAPNALGNLLAVFDKQLEMKVDYDKRRISPNDPELYRHPIVFAHGRRGFSFSAAERKALQDYFDRGGFLFADAICASKPFADSLRAELKAIYPEGQFTRIPPSHPMFTDEFHGFRIGEVTLRDPSLRDESDPLVSKPVKIPPLLEGLEIDGRIVAILSPYDISCALEKGTSLECKGYIPQDAARIGANVILYALQQ